MENKHSPPSKWLRIYKQMDKLVSYVEKFLLFISCLSLVLIFATVLYGIFSREVLNKSILWTNDFASYLIVYLTFLAAPWILKQGAHVSVDFLSAHLKGLSRKINQLVIALVSGTACAIFFWFSLHVTITLYQRGTVMMENIPWPKFALIAPIPVGTFFLVIRFILIIVQVLSGQEKKVKREQTAL